MTDELKKSAEYTPPEVNLGELFSRDPAKHTDADIDTIIANLRERRARYILDNDKKAGAKKAPAKPKSRSPLADIKLEIKL